MHRNGTKVISVVGAVRHARKVRDSGVDVIVAQGHDGGGHNASVGTLALGLPPLLGAAVIFPTTLRLAAGGAAGQRLGGLLAANTVGGILGSVAASFLLLEHVGLWRSLGLLALSYALAGLLVGRAAGPRAWRAAVLAAGLGVVLLSPANPWTLPSVLPPATQEE